MAKKCYNSDGTPKCPGEYCTLHDGKCIKKKKSGEPYKNKYSDDSHYYFDEKYGLVGTKKDVKAYIDGIKGKKSDTQKSPSPKKTKKVSPKSITINENLSKMTIDKLKDLIEKFGISEEEVGKSGKNGKSLKQDYITAIEDHQARKSKKESIKVSSPKPPKNKKNTPSPKKTNSPGKSSRGKRVKSDTDSMTGTQLLEELKTYKEFEGMSDYQIKKVVGAKVGDLRMAVIAKREQPSAKTPSPSPKKKTKTPSPKKKTKTPSPKKKTKTPSPKKKTPSPKKKTKKVKTKTPSPSPTKIRKGLVKGKKMVEKQESCGDDHMTSKNLSKYKKCDKDSVCDFQTGNCIPDTEKYTKGKYMLEIDGRRILGNKIVIEKLQKTIGGKIHSYSPKKSPPKRKSVGKKSPPRRKIIEEDSTESGEGEEDIAGTFAKELEKIAKKSPSGSIKKSPKGGSIKKSPKGSVKTSPPKMTAKLNDPRKDVAKTFAECLSKL